MKVAAIVLAAGESRRMGRAKLTLPYGSDGRTIVETVVMVIQATPVYPITVVLGANWKEIQFVLSDLGVELSVNPNPELGMLSSARWALSHLEDTVDAYMFVLGDQPQIETRIVERILEMAEYSDKGIVLPEYNGKRGHPLLIRARYKGEILRLPDTGGLNQLLQAHPDDIEEVPVDTDSILRDIDTPADYEEAIRDAASISET